MNSLDLVWHYHAGVEKSFDSRVLDDPRYQAFMDDYFGVGRRWRAYLLERTRQLTEFTGIPVTTPAPELNFVPRFGELESRTNNTSSSGAGL
jgi:hypothetical protein